MYDYQKEREALLTERGQFWVCEALLDAQALARPNGLIPHNLIADKVTSLQGVADTYRVNAVIDRLLELRYLARADNGDQFTPRQSWIYQWIARSRS